MRAAILFLSLPLLAGSCFGPLSVTKVDEPSDEELFELYATTATYLYDDDSLVRAQDQAVKALQLMPEDRAMRRMVGWIRLRLGTPEDLLIAEEFFRALLNEGDESRASLLGLASTLERLGLAYDLASEDYATGKRVPDSGDAQEEARELASKSRDLWHESLGLYERTFEDGESSIRAMNGLQRVHALMGNYEESLTWSTELLSRSDDELRSWRRMLTAAELTESEENLFRTNESEAIELQKETHLFAASILRRLNRPDEAITHLDHVLEFDPRLPQAYSQRAQLLAHVGEYQRAIEDLDRYLRLSKAPFEHPDIRRAFELRSQCEAELEQAATERAG